MSGRYPSSLTLRVSMQMSGRYPSSLMLRVSMQLIATRSVSEERLRPLTYSPLTLIHSYNRTMHPFKEKVALITGGSSGIGRATALRLARLGAQIVVASRNQTALDEVVTEVENNGGQALAVATDVTQPEDCRRAVEATVAHFGRLDILLCSAG